jgi:hypothetical protein
LFSLAEFAHQSIKYFVFDKGKSVEMKVLPFILLIVLILFTISSAQSGRRVKSAPVQTATPQVQVTQNTSETEESVGYSESSPNASRSILRP